MSDFAVGLWLFPVPDNPRRSSGAAQRIVPLLQGSVSSSMGIRFFVIDECPKSIRWGIPCLSTRIFGYKGRILQVSFALVKKVTGHSTHPFQVSVDHLNRVEMMKATRDAE